MTRLSEIIDDLNTDLHALSGLRSLPDASDISTARAEAQALVHAAKRVGALCTAEPLDPFVRAAEMSIARRACEAVAHLAALRRHKQRDVFDEFLNHGLRSGND